MRIELKDVGKRFVYEWIFRKLDFEFRYAGKYAILGANGSGKSTLMRVLSGHSSPSKGKIHFFDESGKEIPSDEVFRHVSLVAPYIDLVEEFTLEEALRFHLSLSKDGMDFKEVLEMTTLPKSAFKKQIKFFSSGMKQRVKLAQAFGTGKSLILLDEPTTNLDKEGIHWYEELIKNHGADKTLIVASNDERDYRFIESSLQITDYKS